MQDATSMLPVSRRSMLVGMGAMLAGGCRTPSGPSTDRLLHRDDFRSGLRNWAIEAERGGTFRAEDGVLDIDSPAGVTLWFRHPLRSPVVIDYQVIAVAAGDPNDEVSDINCFWMASDPQVGSGDVLARRRSGAFADYDDLRTYYAGLGGNRNSSSRFRRYVGRNGDRPLLSEHDLAAPADLIEANRPYRIRLIANGPRIALVRDGRTMFQMLDPEPYGFGYFGLRTTKSHLRVLDFSISRPAG